MVVVHNSTGTHFTVPHGADHAALRHPPSTDFESFEALARPGRSPEEIARILTRLARAALRLQASDRTD
jgi:hypothetical protein